MPPHAGVDLDVDAQRPPRARRQRAGEFARTEARQQIVHDRRRRFFRLHRADDEDRRLDALTAQFFTFADVRDREAGGAGGQGCLRDALHAVAVRVRLDDGENIAGTDEATPGLVEIMDQATEVNPGERGRGR